MKVGCVTVPGAHPCILKFHAFSNPATMDDAECMVDATITPPLSLGAVSTGRHGAFNAWTDLSLVVFVT